MTGFSIKSQKSSLHRSQGEINQDANNGVITNENSIERLLRETAHKADEDSEQGSQKATLPHHAQKELAQLYKMSNIQKYIAETRVPSQAISTTQQFLNDKGQHAFLQADSSIAALDSTGQVNYGNVMQYEASKDFIVISDKDAHSRDSPRGSIGRRNKFVMDSRTQNSSIIFRSNKRFEDRSLKQQAKKIFKPQGGGGNFQSRHTNPAMNISVDIKNKRDTFNRDILSTNPQYRVPDITQSYKGPDINMSNDLAQGFRQRSPVVSKINLGALAGLDLDIAGMSIKMKKQNNVNLQKDKNKANKWKYEGSDPLIMQVRGQSQKQDGSLDRDHKTKGVQAKIVIDSPESSKHKSLSGVSELKSLEKKIDQWSHKDSQGPLSILYSSQSPGAREALEERNRGAPFSMQSPMLQTETSQETRGDSLKNQNSSGQILIHYNQLMEKRNRDQLDALNVYKNSFKNLPSPNREPINYHLKDFSQKRSPKFHRKRQIVDMVPSHQVIQENQQLEDMKMFLNQATPRRFELYRYNQAQLSRESLEGTKTHSSKQDELSQSRGEDFDSPQIISINMGSDLKPFDRINDHNFKNLQNNNIKIVPKNFNLSPAPKQSQNIKITLQNKIQTQKIDEAGDQTAARPQAAETGSSFKHPVEVLDGMNMLAQQISQQSEQTLQEESRLAEILEGTAAAAQESNPSPYSPNTPGYDQNYFPEARMAENQREESQNKISTNLDENRKKDSRTNIKMIFVSSSKQRVKEQSKGQHNSSREKNYQSPEITMNQIQQSEDSQDNSEGAYFESFGSGNYNNKVQQKEKQIFTDQIKSSPPFKVSKLQLQYRDNDSNERGESFNEKGSQGFSEQTPGINPDGHRHPRMTARFQPQQNQYIQGKFQKSPQDLEKLRLLARMKEQNSSKPTINRVSKLQERRHKLEDAILHGDGSRVQRLNRSVDRQELESFFTKQASINYIPSFEEHQARSRQQLGVFKSQIQLPKISQLAKVSKLEDVRRSNDRIFRSQLRGKAGVRNAHTRHRTSSVLPKIDSIVSMSGNTAGAPINFDASRPSLENVFWKSRFDGDDPRESSQIMPVVSRKQRNHYDRFRFYKSKDQASTRDDVAKKNHIQIKDNVTKANKTNMVSVSEEASFNMASISNNIPQISSKINVIESKRESEISGGNLEAKYEIYMPDKSREQSVLECEIPRNDYSELPKHNQNGQTLLSSEKQKVFQVAQQASQSIKKLPITAQDLDMTNINGRLIRKTFDENPQPKGDTELMFQLMSETSQKNTLKVSGADDSVHISNSSPSKIVQLPMQSITGINYNPKITTRQEIMEIQEKIAPTQRHSPNQRSPLINNNNIQSVTDLNKDLTIAVTFHQKDVEIGVQTVQSNAKRQRPVVQIPEQTSRLFRETSGRHLSDSESKISRTGLSPSLNHVHSGPGLPMFQSDRSRKQISQKQSLKQFPGRQLQEFRITKEEMSKEFQSVETDAERETVGDDPLRPSSTMIHNMANKGTDMMNPNSYVRMISPQTVLQQANKEKFNQIQKLKQLQTKFQINESVLKNSSYSRRLELGILSKKTQQDQGSGRNETHMGYNENVNQLGSWHSQRDQVEGMTKDENANQFSLTRGLNFNNEHLKMNPHIKLTRTKQTSPMNKNTGVMREYGYDKMNSIFMNEKVIEKEQNFGNTASKGNQITHRNSSNLMFSPSNTQSKIQLNKKQQVQINNSQNLIAQGRDTNPSYIQTEVGSGRLSPKEAQNQSHTLFGIQKQTSRIDLTDDEMADLEKIRQKPDFKSKGMTQSNFVEKTGQQTLLGSLNVQNMMVDDINREFTQKTHLASISQPGSAIGSYQRNQIIVVQQNNESTKTPIVDTKITELSDNQIKEDFKQLVLQ